MDRKEYGSYEEVHELFVEVMQDACTKDEAGPYRTPDLDMSFLYDDPVPKKRKKIYISSFAKVAAILIIVLLGMNVVLLTTDSNNAYSEKGLLHRIYEGTRGIFTDEDQSKYVQQDEIGEVYIVDDYTKLEDAKKFWRELVVPQYIPDEYDFVKLYISRDVSGNYRADYKYSYENTYLTISIFTLSKHIKNISNDLDEIITIDDRKINIYWDNTYSSYIADVYFEDLFICINSNVSKEKIRKIAMCIE